jgi:hypothetical protein
VTGEALDAMLPYEDGADLLAGDRRDRLRACESSSVSVRHFEHTPVGSQALDPGKPGKLGTSFTESEADPRLEQCAKLLPGQAIWPRACCGTSARSVRR